jgi:hypothetical protein
MIMTRTLTAAILLAMTASASAQQMIGPAFNLPPNIRASYAEHSRQTNAEIARDDLARKCQWQSKCMDNPPAEHLKSMDELQAEAEAGWAYAKHLRGEQ